MKKLKNNKKGFTLVELLAVIVILALLIVITANTVLPMMKKSKKSGMVVYAERVLNNAGTAFQADLITYNGESGSSVERYYSIKELMNADDYYGCVKVTGDPSSYDYSIIIYDAANKIKMEGYAAKTVVSEAVDTVALDWGASESFAKTSYDSQSKCGTAPLRTTLDGYDRNTPTGANKLS